MRQATALKPRCSLLALLLKLPPLLPYLPLTLINRTCNKKIRIQLKYELPLIKNPYFCFFGKAFFSKERFVIITVAHDAFKPFLRNNPLLVKVFSLEKKLMNNDPILIDIRGMFNREEAERMGFCYRGL